MTTESEVIKAAQSNIIDMIGSPLQLKKDLVTFNRLYRLSYNRGVVYLTVKEEDKTYKLNKTVPVRLLKQALEWPSIAQLIYVLHHYHTMALANEVKKL